MKAHNQVLPQVCVVICEIIRYGNIYQVNDDTRSDTRKLSNAFDLLYTKDPQRPQLIYFTFKCS